MAVEKIKIELNGKECYIPKADLDWFVKEKGAKVVGSKESKQKEPAK